MTRTSFLHRLPRFRASHRAFTRMLSLALVVVILATQTPAMPRPLGDLVSDLHADYMFWLRSSGWAKTLGGLMSQSAAVQPESQSDRDARVASIKAFPGDVTLQKGTTQFFDALAFDSKDQQVGGVKFTWRAEFEATKKQVWISQTGEFSPPHSGRYKITAEGVGKTAQLTATASDGPVQPPPKVVEEPGPGWDAGNSGAASNPDNERGDPPGKPLHHGAGTGNFQIAAPILSLPGRGIDLSLSAIYNSRIWTKSSSGIIYDIDRDWPAAGWSLGFGRVAGMGTSGSMLIDADGTRHSFSGPAPTGSGGVLTFNAHTTDGTFIDYVTTTDNTGVINFANVKLPNGTVIQYGAPGRGAVYPLRITDANGNYISVHYRFNSGAEHGPKIDFIVDTLERQIRFYYDQGKLTAITAPGIDGAERPLVRLLYQTMTLSYAFSGLTPNVYDPQPRVLKAIYYPGTGTGYWFGDSNSYSSYGMLAKCSEQRGMGFSAASLDVEGTVTPGAVTRECVYDYPMNSSSPLTDAPTYSTLTETWDGIDTAPAVTHYLMQRNSTQRWTTITFPDQTKSVQYSYNAPGLYNDGYIFRDETRDANDAVLRYSTVTWEQGDYGSARPVRIEAFDERNQMTKAEFVYGGPYNQVTTVRDYDYGGVALLRTTGVLYRNNTEYTGRHIFNLVRRVDVWNASLDTLMSRVEYNHDEPADSTLVNTLSVVQHNEAYNPYIPPDCRLEDDPDDPDCWGGCLENVASQGCDGICHQIEVCTGGYVPATHYRGNVTSVTRYAAAANAPEEPSPPGAPNIGGAITEIRTYDITGNMVTASTSCCEQMSFVYTLATQFAHPDSQTRGSADTASAARITTSADYNFNTSLTISAKDANQLQSQISYFAANLRPQTLTLPTLGSTTYAYDDVAMSVTETANASGGAVASQNVKLLNGLGQVKLESALGNNSIVDFVATQYDQMGRVKIQTRPYRTGQDPQPTETFYDALGRAERIVAPDGSESRSYFNETTRPSTASSLPGQTTRVVDAWGQERWARLDADGRLVEVVEPDPLGNGSVLSTGTLVTNLQLRHAGQPDAGESRIAATKVPLRFAEPTHASKAGRGEPHPQRLGSVRWQRHLERDVHL